MAGVIKARPGGGEFYAKALQGVVTDFIGEGAGPNPLNAQGSLTPAFDGATLPVSDRNTDPGARDRSSDLWPELERHAGLDRQEIKARGLHSDVAWFAHSHVKPGYFF